MGIFQRMTDIAKSNINALLDKCEDPEKMVDQMLLELREKLAECKKQTSGVIAAESQAKRALDECQDNVDKYDKAAMNAVASGADDDARALLEKKQKFKAKLPDLQASYDAANANADAARENYEQLSAAIEDLESRKADIKAKMAAAKAQEAVNKATAGASASAGASLAAFDRMEAKADAALDRAMAERDLNKAASGTDDLMKKYSGGGSASVDDELAAMKAKLGKQ